MAQQQEIALPRYVADPVPPVRLPPGRTIGSITGVAVTPDGHIWMLHIASNMEWGPAGQSDDPALRLGPPSWGWVAEAFASGARLQADPRLATLTTPILMLVADEDGLVDPAAAVRLAGRLPDVELVRFGPESAHEILREADGVRLRAYRLIDAFLAKRLAA